MGGEAESRCESGPRAAGDRVTCAIWGAAQGGNTVRRSWQLRARVRCRGSRPEAQPAAVSKPDRASRPDARSSGMVLGLKRLRIPKDCCMRKPTLNHLRLAETWGTRPGMEHADGWDTYSRTR